MNEKLKFLWLNLQQFIIFYDEPNCVNAVAAIGSKFKGILVIRPEYRDEVKDIKKAASYVAQVPKWEVWFVRWGDGFTVDTWDRQIHNYNPDTADHKYLPSDAVVINP